MTRNVPEPPWLLLGSVTALGPLAMGVHIPGIDRIALALGEPVVQAQLSVPAFIVAFGFGMFGAGDIVDRLGLRFALGVGLLTFVLGALFAGVTTSLTLLLIGRFLMGTGAAFAIVVPRVAVAIDSAMATNRLARLAAIQSAVPALAPLLGAGIVAWLGWRATFLLPGAAAVGLLVATTLWLPKHERSRSDNVAMQASSFVWLRSRGWLLATTEIALVTAVFLVLLAQTSNLLVEPFRLDASELGVVLALTGAAFVTGSVVLVRAKESVPLQRVSRVAFIGAMVLLAVGSSSALVWVVGLVVYALANGVLVPAAFGAIAREALTSKGRVLGVAGAIQMLVGAAGGATANAIGGLTPTTFGVGGLLIALTVFALTSLGRRSSHF